MRFPLSWIGQYVDLPADEAAAARLFTLSGSEVEGMEAVEGETVFEFGITVNRPDCMNVYGLAREASALLEKPLRAIEAGCAEDVASVSSLTSVTVEAKDLCPRYRARLVTGARVGQSPAWMQKRLIQCGLRPINAVVDATNYVLLEMGHPLHAFDLAALKERRIVVRRARAGEKITTLDGFERKLGPEMLVIADSEKAAAVAGVMGGASTGVTMMTRDILLEGAVFDPVNIRRTSKALGMHTDASHRFERGVDFNGPEAALDLCARLITETCGGKVAKGTIDEISAPKLPVTVAMRLDSVRKLIGLEIPPEKCASILARLGFQIKKRGERQWDVTVPSWRVDISREVDLVEEIVRVNGLDDLPATQPRVVDPVGGRPSSIRAQESLRDSFRAAGFTEIIQMSFGDPAMEKIVEPNVEPLRLANPMAETSSALRTTLSAGLLATARKNRARGARRMALFEVGDVFLPATDGGVSEEPRAALLFFEDDPARRWGAPSERGLLHLKGAIEEAFGRFGCQIEFVPEESVPFAKGHALSMLMEGSPVGRLGTVDPALLEGLLLRGKAHAAEFSLKGMERFSGRLQFKPFSKFPAIIRDFSIIVPTGVTWETIKRTVEGLSLAHLAAVELVEVYQGAELPKGAKSFSFSLVFQSLDRTLEEKDVCDVPATVEKALREAAGATLRSGESHAV
ncbi:MAG: phenylalanine--tRNA ligase subunit beta [Acidobacteria bacterium]|nr:phenylalanine--tRNA ligase subunit beta [Acidobacteriota bacterium]